MILRKMLMADADFLLEMKNYKETIQYAIATKDEIKKEDHLKWLENNIQYFQIIEDREGKLIGALRIQDNEVSIWIAREYWKMGIATFILQHHTDRSHWCKIVAGNVGSMRAFIRAGFLPYSFHETYYIFKK